MPRSSSPLRNRTRAANGLSKPWLRCEVLNKSSNFVSGFAPCPDAEIRIFAGAPVSQRTRSRLKAIASATLSSLLLAASPCTGRLLLIDEEKQGVAGVDGLTGARGVAVSPDGRHVYSIGILDDAISSFDRNIMSGRLTFKQVLRNGVDSVSGMDGPVQLALSPDGLFAYVVTQSDSIAIFRREPGSGLLTFVTAELGVGLGQGATFGVSSITVSGDGRHVYAGSAGTDPSHVTALIAFSRDGASGLLSIVDVELDQVSGVVNMRSVDSMALNPDGNRLYAIGYQTFVIFERMPDGTLSFLNEALGSLASNFGTGAVTVAEDDRIFAAAEFGGFGAAGILRENPNGSGIPVLTGTIFDAGLGQPRSIAATIPRAFMFVGGITGVGAFRVGEDDGLAFSEEIREPITAVFSVAVSPDSQHLYATGAASDNLVAFRILSDPTPVEIPALSEFGAAAMLAAFVFAIATTSAKRHRRV